jgi:hypothetical protein
MGHSVTKFDWVKPLKRSQKARLRKELKKQKKLDIVKEEIPKLENCDWKPSGLSFGGKSRITENGWEYKLL